MKKILSQRRKLRNWSGYASSWFHLPKYLGRSHMSHSILYYFQGMAALGSLLYCFYPRSQSQTWQLSQLISLSFCGHLRRPWLRCGDSDDLHVRELPRPHPPPRLSMVELACDFAVLESSARRRGAAMASWVRAVHAEERSAVRMEERSGNGVLTCPAGLQ
jgi:hypothetical protein